MKFYQTKKYDPYENANFFPGPGYYDASNLTNQSKYFY